MLATQTAVPVEKKKEEEEEEKKKYSTMKMKKRFSRFECNCRVGSWARAGDALGCLQSVNKLHKSHMKPRWTRLPQRG
jgi:hypothetical protein